MMHNGAMNTFLFQKILFSFSFFQIKIKIVVTLSQRVTLNPIQDVSTFLIILTFIGSLWVALIKVIAVLMLSVKPTTPGPFKIKVIQNEGYFVISVYDFCFSLILPYPE